MFIKVANNSVKHWAYTNTSRGPGAQGLLDCTKPVTEELAPRDHTVRYSSKTVAEAILVTWHIFTMDTQTLIYTCTPIRTDLLYQTLGAGKMASPLLQIVRFKDVVNRWDIKMCNTVTGKIKPNLKQP